MASMSERKRRLHPLLVSILGSILRSCHRFGTFPVGRMTSQWLHCTMPIAHEMLLH